MRERKGRGEIVHPHSFVSNPSNLFRFFKFLLAKNPTKHVFLDFSFVFFVFLSDFTPENSFHLRLFLPYLPSLSQRRGWQAFDCGYITLCITWNRWRLSNIVGTQTCNCRLSSETIRSMDQRAEHDYWIRLGWYIPMIPSWRFVFSISENLTP